jgi:4'-phosphopantetheinyl transferase EntD
MQPRTLRKEHQVCPGSETRPRCAFLRVSGIRDLSAVMHDLLRAPRGKLRRFARLHAHVRSPEFTRRCLWRVGSSLDLERAHNPKVAGSNPAPATIDNEGLADARPLTPFVYPDFTQESVCRQCARLQDGRAPFGLGSSSYPAGSLQPDYLGTRLVQLELRMTLDVDHPTLRVLQRLVPEAIAVGGSFARTLPHPNSVIPAARAAAFASAQEFATEQCIRSLLRRAGLRTDLQIRRRIGGGPKWPADFVGSLTHKGTVVLGVIAARSGLTMIGLDLERIDQSDLLPIERLVAPEGLPPGTDRQLGTLLAFSAKEALFKAQYPTNRKRLDFSQVRLTWAGNGEEGFRATVECPVLGLEVRTAVTGKWLVSCALSFKNS